MATTTNMQLVLPTVESTLGPEWAQLLNEALQLVDTHDHSTSKGVKITPSGMNINADVDFNEVKIVDAGSVGLTSKVSAEVATTGSIQRVGSDLYWVNSAGTAVQITSGSGLNLAGSGALSIVEPGSYPYSVTTANAQTVVVVNTTSARTLNLPAATNAFFFMIKDKNGQAETNNISVVPNGTDTIDGANATYTIDANFMSIGLISDGVSAWYVV